MLSIHILLNSFICGWLLISSRLITATSLALDVCPSTSSPQQLIKCVLLIPSSRAFSFILSTNTFSAPLICSAIATQASLALATAIHLIIVLTLCISPDSRNTWLPPIEAAYSDTVTGSSILMLPSSIASNISISVIIFVMLAGARTVSASFSYITCPVAASISIAEGVSMSGPDTSSAQQKTGTITAVVINIIMAVIIPVILFICPVLSLCPALSEYSANTFIYPDIIITSYNICYYICPYIPYYTLKS